MWCRGTTHCDLCGKPIHAGYRRKCIGILESPQKLGDWMEARLTSLGITKERYVAIKESIGLPPTCNCAARQEYMNRVGEKFGATVSSALAKLWG